MLDWMQRNPLVAALAFLAVVLAAVIGIEIATGGLRAPTPDPVPRKVAAAEAKLLPPTASTPPEQAYPETTSRPLFTPTRRPAPDVPAAPVQRMQQGQFVLLGVTMAGNTRIAMLREKASGRLHRAEVGREVNGMRILQIERESVVLGLGDERESLGLSVQRPGGGPPGAVPPPQASVQGPFAAAAAPPPPGATGVPPPPPGSPPPGGTPLMAVPPGQNPQAGFGAAGTAPGQPGQAAAAPGPAAPTTNATSAPMTPEELLARRRARRAQQPTPQ